MTGHHIYTRSWFELGSKSQNAGTFTVELSNGIFGDQSDDVIYNRLNPMYAAVPEALAPLNSGKSMLRVFHPLPDTTVICRNWFVTDEITGRGPVPYAFSLIFRGGSNDVFLRHPAKAFTPEAMETYDSFRARVTPDAPVAISRSFDPRKEDYSSPFVFSKSEWVETFGFDRELFIAFYVSLCRSICGKGNTRVGVVLPADADGELLIMATLALLPMFLKRKFGATSNWKGMMDGSGSRGISNLHLICCYETAPLTDTKLPIVDMTGAGRHENIEIADKSYAGWVWDNLDNESVLARFEGFLNENFESVLDRMPYQVIENCFMLWNVFVNMKKTVDFKLAAIIIKLITDSFAKNFAKFPFISARIKDCLTVIGDELAGNPGADLTLAVVQAICLLAGNGEENSRNLVYDLYRHFYDKGDWKKVAVTATYYSGLMEQPDISAQTENLCSEVLLGCLACADPGGAKVAQGAIEKYCLKLRSIILSDAPGTEESLTTYCDAILALYSAVGGRLGGSFFQFPEQSGAVSLDVASRFTRLMDFDINRLGYLPTQSQWIYSLQWLEPLTRDERGKEVIRGMYKLYYDKTPVEYRRDYILYIENKHNKLLLLIIQSYPYIRNDVERILSDRFAEEITKAGYALDMDDTWAHINGWLDRLDVLKFTDYDVIYSHMRQVVRLDKNILINISGTISNGSLLTIVRLYGTTDPQFVNLLYILHMIDTAALTGSVDKNIAQNSRLFSVQEIRDARIRMDYWYTKSFTDPAEWALLMLTATMGSVGFNVSEFIRMCRTKNKASSDAVGPEDMVCVLTAMKLLDEYDDYYRRELLMKFRNMIVSTLNEYNSEDIFVNVNVARAFSRISPVQWKHEVGRTIAERLYRDKGVSDDIRDVYYQIKRSSSNKDAAVAPRPVLITSVLGLMLLALAAIMLFMLSGGMVGAVFGATVSLWVPYILAFLIALSSVVTAVMYLSKK